MGPEENRRKSPSRGPKGRETFKGGWGKESSVVKNYSWWRHLNFSERPESRVYVYLLFEPLPLSKDKETKWKDWNLYKSLRE